MENGSLVNLMGLAQPVHPIGHESMYHRLNLLVITRVSEVIMFIPCVSVCLFVCVCVSMFVTMFVRTI